MCKSDTNLFRARGFSLVELMVAVVIGLLVLAAVSTVMVNSKKNYTVQDSLARLQENARVAVDFVTRDLRTVGYFGCSNDRMAFKNNLVGGGGAAPPTPIEAIENSSAASTWSPSGTANITGVVPGTDALTLRFMNGAGVPVIAPFMTDPAAVLTIAAGSNLNMGDTVMVADCASADVFQITSAAPNTSGTLAHAPGVGAPGNIDDDGDSTNKFGVLRDKMYENQSFIAKFTEARYFVGARCTTTGANCATGEGNGIRCTADPCTCDAEHRCSLFRQLDGTTQELVEGIESMQILYGMDTDQPTDRVPNVYVSGANVGVAGQWLRVVSVRIGLLAYTQASETESGEYGGVTDQGSTYDVNGTVLTSKKTPDYTKNEIQAKRMKRRVFTTTVSLRNQQQ